MCYYLEILQSVHVEIGKDFLMWVMQADFKPCLALFSAAGGTLHCCKPLSPFYEMIKYNIALYFYQG